jgi:ribonuclease J
MERKLAKGKLASLREAWSKSEILIETLRAEPERYVMVFQNSMLNADFDGSLPDKTRLIYSRWDGYLQQDSFVSLRDSVEESGGVVDLIHTSGHIYDFDLARTIAEIQPKSLKAIHTFEPDLLLQLHSG